MSPRPPESTKRRLLWSACAVGAAALTITSSAWWVLAYLVGCGVVWFIYLHSVPPKPGKPVRAIRLVKPKKGKK